VDLLPKDLQRKSVTPASKTPSERVVQKVVDQAVNNALKDIGKTKFTCYLCGSVGSIGKRKRDFHTSTDPLCKTTATRICKKCVERIVYQIGEDGVKHEPTVESMKAALEYLDKPWIENLYQSSLEEFDNPISKKPRSDVWNTYIKNVSMGQYNTMRWHDGDFLPRKDFNIDISEDSLPEDQVVLDEYKQNKKDAIRLLGYDPFKDEALADQPFMYSQLIGYLDAGEDANNDMMRVSSIIAIVKGFNHRNKMDALIANYMKDTDNLNQHIQLIKQLEDTKSKIGSDIQKLAQESRISLNSNKAATKENDTWTGKVKMLKNKKLRDQEENAFEIGVSMGMRQVAEISDEALFNRISLDESASAEIIADQRRLLTKFKNAAEDAVEQTRILLRENKDLKATLKELGINLSASSEKLKYDYHNKSEEGFLDTLKDMSNYSGVEIFDDEDEEDFDEDIEDTEENNDE
jgi:hypothetical protein